MRRRWIGRLAAVAALVAGGALAMGGHEAARAEALTGEPVLAFRISEDLPLGRTFSLMSAPAGAPGTLPSGLAPFSGLLEVCARGPEGGGRLFVTFEGDAAVTVEQTGCQQIDIETTTTVNLQSVRGDWDVALRRLIPAEEARPASSYLVAKVPERTPFGRNLPLMTTPPTAVGAAPEATTLLNGAVEICARGPAIGGELVVLVNDAVTAEITESGCRTLTVSEAGSATFVSRFGPWDVIVRPGR